MLKQFIAHVQQQHLFPSGQQVLLAVSGGIDSVVLAHLMHSAGFPFAMAHCNFHLRPGDCDRDESFVRDLASQYSVPFFVAQFDTLTFAKHNHLCVEDAARKLRYDFFAKLARDNNYYAILTAHHRDDANETFFINLLRGTGIAGLHGILPVQGNIVRPLLPFGRVEIEQYAIEHHLAHVDDVTNDSLEYRRNQIRHQVLPLLREISPSSDSAINQTICNLQSVEQLYHYLLQPLRDAYIKNLDNGTIRVSLDLPHNEVLPQLLFELIRPYGFNASDISDILSASQPGKQFLSSDYLAVLDRQCLLISPLSRICDDALPEITVSLEEASAFHSFEELLVHLKSLPSTQAVFDADRVTLPLSLRHWEEGDRFQPLGMAKGSQLLSDYFSDHKYDLLSKQRQLLLVDASGKILWIVGRRTSHLVRVTPSSTRLLRVEVDAKSSNK